VLLCLIFLTLRSLKPALLREGEYMDEYKYVEHASDRCLSNYVAIDWHGGICRRFGTLFLAEKQFEGRVASKISLLQGK